MEGEKPKAVTVEELVKKFFGDYIPEGSENWYEVKDEAERIYRERVDRYGIGDDKSDFFTAIRLLAIQRHLQGSRS